MTKICEVIENLDFKPLKEVHSIEEKWSLFKNILLKIVDDIARVREISLKNINQFLWYDEELLKLGHLKDSNYKRFTRSGNHEDKNMFDY